MWESRGKTVVLQVRDEKLVKDFTISPPFGKCEYDKLVNCFTISAKDNNSMQTQQLAPVVINTATTWRQFQQDNDGLTVKAMTDAWASLCRDRQAEYKARYDAATSGVTFKKLGGIAMKTNKRSGIGAGQYRLAAVRAVTATKRELEQQRHRDTARVAKRDAGYAQLIAEAGE